MVTNIGNFVRQFIHMDPNFFDDMWKAIMRIRAKVDIQKPLKVKMKIKKQGGDWNCIQFKYERLPNFCFFCGIIRHSDRFCEKRFDALANQRELKYDKSLRAPNRPTLQLTRVRWLTTSGGGQQVIKNKVV